jgi:hypothetical protein
MRCRKIISSSFDKSVSIAMDSKIYILLVLLASACVSVESTGYNYGMYWNYGGHPDSQLGILDTDFDGDRQVYMQGSCGAFPMAVTKLTPSGQTAPWNAVCITTASGGYVAYGIEITDTTKWANQYLTVDACYSGQNGDSQTLALAIQIDGGSAGTTTSPLSQEKFDGSDPRTVCAQFLIENKYLKTDAQITFTAFATETVQLTAATFSVRAVSHFTTVSTLTVGTYATLLQLPPTQNYVNFMRGSKQIGFGGTTNLITSNIFPSGTPWTVNKIPATPQPGYTALQIKLGSQAATQLADQFLVVDFVISGAVNDGFGPGFLAAYLTISGTGGTFTSALCIVNFDSDISRRLYIPFIIPNQYLVSDAVISMYGSTEETDPSGSFIYQDYTAGFSLMISSHRMVY